MMSGSQAFRTLLLGALVIFGQLTGVIAAELKIMTPRSMWTVLNEIGPEFERTSGYKLNVVTDIAATLANRIIAGEKFDVFIGPPIQMDRVIGNQKVMPETRSPIARSGIGAEVRAGASNPDISSVEGFKNALLNDKSIGYLKQPGTSGAYLHGLFERLGVAEAIKSKVIRPETDVVSEMDAKGEIDLGMVVITQIMTTPGVELVGPIPRELQYYVKWSGGVSVSSGSPEVAKDVIALLKSARALPVLIAQGMEPE
jgi:molybdate transport system substrate-binding protein